MKIKEDYVLKNICGDNMVIYVGTDSADFRRTIRLNDTAAFMWNCFIEGCSVADCAGKVAEEYGIDASKALADTEKFADKLIENNLAEK